MCTDKKRLSRLNEAESFSSDTILFFFRFAISDIRVVSGREVYTGHEWRRSPESADIVVNERGGAGDRERDEMTGGRLHQDIRHSLFLFFCLFSFPLTQSISPVPSTRVSYFPPLSLFGIHNTSTSLLFSHFPSGCLSACRFCYRRSVP